METRCIDDAEVVHAEDDDVIVIVFCKNVRNTAYENVDAAMRLIKRYL